MKNFDLAVGIGMNNAQTNKDYGIPRRTLGDHVQRPKRIIFSCLWKRALDSNNTSDLFRNIASKQIIKREHAAGWLLEIAEPSKSQHGWEIHGYLHLNQHRTSCNSCGQMYADACSTSINVLLLKMWCYNEFINFERDI